VDLLQTETHWMGMFFNITFRLVQGID